MQILWSDQAINDLDSIINYISQDNRDAAIGLALDLLNAVEHVIVDTPFIGRPGRVEATREFTGVTPYIFVYQVTSNRLEVITLRHGARRWPERFDPLDQK